MRYHGIVLLFIFFQIISTAFSDEPEKDGGEKRIGYEDGQITSVTVYTGDTKPTGETVPSTGTGTGSGTSGGGSADSGTTTGGAQQQGPFTGFPGRPRPRPRPGHGRPGHWFRPFGYRGGRRTVSQGEEEENSSSENVGSSPQ
ncbi:uncharacterized protein LOC124362291 [Homalodisca vitripennis]|uniref:uncharacterized protein LOC124362291 n=1 Tax=Homalodisca vitripennis TaxID=197043 RepID=UPI001EEC0152|nr:uncharacterized protein LOC124362291 [Homalodisca vitripennis]